MRIIGFYHSLESDWNHGNAHFLRGICSELIARGHDVEIYEPSDAWSRANIVQEYGLGPIELFYERYPWLKSVRYQLPSLDLPRVLESADLVLVHEWNDPELVRRIGAHHAHDDHYRLLFHDTHHRSVTDSDSMSMYDLANYDGVLAYGEAIREIYLKKGWARQVWTWHEAADVRVFHPMPDVAQRGDLVWIGNWGDDERAAELREYLVEPVRALGLQAEVYGVRYPDSALRMLESNGIAFRGWLPNYEVSETFAGFRVTVHVPRRPYAEALRGIPTIRPFEALACGIPLVSAPWQDSEGLFAAGEDYLVARNRAEMRDHLQSVLNDPALARSLSEHGRRKILTRHTCGHRVDELLKIVSGISQTVPPEMAMEPA